MLANLCNNGMMHPPGELVQLVPLLGQGDGAVGGVLVVEYQGLLQVGCYLLYLAQNCRGLNIPLTFFKMWAIAQAFEIILSYEGTVIIALRRSNVNT